MESLLGSGSVLKLPEAFKTHVELHQHRMKNGNNTGWMDGFCSTPSSSAVAATLKLLLNCRRRVGLILVLGTGKSNFISHKMTRINGNQ